MWSPFSFFSTVAETMPRLIELAGKLSAMKGERREGTATYLAALSDCLGRVAKHIESGADPDSYELRSACAELAQHATTLPEVVGQVVGQEEARHLAWFLQCMDGLPYLYTIRTYLGLADTKDVARLAVQRMAEASGMLRAMSAQIRAGN